MPARFAIARTHSLAHALAVVNAQRRRAARERARAQRIYAFPLGWAALLLLHAKCDIFINLWRIHALSVALTLSLWVVRAPRMFWCVCVCVLARPRFYSARNGRMRLELGAAAATITPQADHKQLCCFVWDLVKLGEKWRANYLVH